MLECSISRSLQSVGYQEHGLELVVALHNGIARDKKEKGWAE
jgi:hypothetical protein